MAAPAEVSEKHSNFRIRQFKEICHYNIAANLMLNTMASFVILLTARTARIACSDRQTHTHTRDNYCNSLCACAPRVNNGHDYHLCALDMLKPTNTILMTFKNYDFTSNLNSYCNMQPAVKMSECISTSQGKRISLTIKFCLCRSPAFFSHVRNWETAIKKKEKERLV